MQYIYSYGKLGEGIMSKRFTNLAKHSMIKIQTSFHFLDSWKGEVGFMQLDTGANNAREYVWTEKYDSSDFERD